MRRDINGGRAVLAAIFRKQTGECSVKNFTVVRGLILLAVFQLLVLAGEYLTSVYPLWAGEEVLLRIRPFDPRSLFRGNYVRLNYDISMITGDALPDGLGRLKRGDVAYVLLEEQNGIYDAKSITLEKPDEGLFIRGRIQGSSPGARVNLKYGIEAYFAAKERALEIEAQLRPRAAQRNSSNFSSNEPQEIEEPKQAFARVRITSSGKAALDDIQWGL
jgi:uncharacterized membrane-anchored protein